jgi:hypothetical protein
MKYLKKYLENHADLQHAVVKIKEKYSEQKVANMLNNEIAEWTDNGNYKDISNGEAEEIVIHQLINWYKKEFNKKIEEFDIAKLEDLLKSEYVCLN